ncbi:Radical SAM superfamily protein [Botrimarina colliarenosi]|uniref:Radical SAM superfamily protein n=1 Tax=Botrimarina colliarenosi TaxID=2528001 RepID=A0A5C6AQQ2_9BACT|nr:PA0069 family radical SAM protein [Botrimarina colliarenosi]TWU00524.1 Radical SAM superfamily protein [Botrimarina colliarenosi]
MLSTSANEGSTPRGDLPSAPAPASSFAGRGSAFRPANPHTPVDREADWEHVAHDAEFLASQGLVDPSSSPQAAARLRTTVETDASRSIVNHNDSPDLPFRWSLNPYRGCEHGCSYCYARPTHEFLGLDAGLGFESRIIAKTDAPELLRKWLARPSWRPEPIVFSGVTDCYQPVERRLEITRRCLAVAAECRQPVGLVTKNALVTRDLDLLGELAKHRAAVVAVSLTTLDEKLARRMEPRTSTPTARLEAIAELAAAGVPTHAMIAPVIPGLNDHEIPDLLAAARDAGVHSASYTLLRLAGSVRDVFVEWLRRCEPNRAPKVEALIGGVRGGRWNDPRFGARMTGVGAYAGQISRTFRVFAHREGLQLAPEPLSGEAFRPPAAERQLALF